MSNIKGIVQFSHKGKSNNIDLNLLKIKEWLSNTTTTQTLLGENFYFVFYLQSITPEPTMKKLLNYHQENKIAITADAIIDNRPELLSLLNVDATIRKNITDSELILLSFSKWGEDCPKYLIGDFAFMIWDENEQKLFGARDFSGTRTLYYNFSDGKLTFSTLLEPLLQLPYVGKKLNEEWLSEFLAIPTMVEAVDMNSTVYDGIMQVPPSHCITVTKDKLSLRRYITLQADQSIKFKRNEDYEEAFKEVFQRAVNDRLRTDGKVGAHLSGGLDSGSVVSFAASGLRKQNKTLHTFSYYPVDDFDDFTDNYYLPDERPLIKETINHVGNIDPTYLNFNDEDPYSCIDDFLNIMEMPYKFFENTFWLKGITEEASKRGIKVLLNGSRGNHSISWGSYRLTYDYYISLLWKLQWIKFYEEIDNYCRVHRTGKKVVLPFITKKALATLYRKSSTSTYSFPSMINTEFAKRTNVFSKLEHFGLNHNGTPVKDLDQYRNQYYKQLYPWNKSGTADTKLSLRYGVWNRDPTNDIRVNRFCLSLPKEQYVTGGLERSLIRRATKGVLPDSVRLNTKYRGVQGADTIHRMRKKWAFFISELETIKKDSFLEQYINMDVFNQALNKMNTGPRQEAVFEDEFKVLTRSIILNRFLKAF